MLWAACLLNLHYYKPRKAQHMIAFISKEQYTLETEASPCLQKWWRLNKTPSLLLPRHHLPMRTVEMSLRRWFCPWSAECSRGNSMLLGMQVVCGGRRMYPTVFSISSSRLMITNGPIISPVCIFLNTNSEQLSLLQFQRLWLHRTLVIYLLPLTFSQKLDWLKTFSYLLPVHFPSTTLKRSFLKLRVR